MCVSSFKKGFTSLSLKTRLLDEKQHRSTHWLLLLLLAITTALLLYDVLVAAVVHLLLLDWRHQLLLCSMYSELWLT